GPDPTLEQYSWCAIVAGSFFLAGSFIVDKRWGSEFSFLPYIYATLIFWGGWTALFGYPIYSSFGFRCVYLLINLFLLGFGIYVQKIVFWVFGSLGTIYFIGIKTFFKFKELKI